MALYDSYVVTGPISRIEQRGKANHRVNPGGAGGKWLEGGEASSALGVEKPVTEEPR